MDKITKKNKVLDQFEQQKLDFEKKQQQENHSQPVNSHDEDEKNDDKAYHSSQTHYEPTDYILKEENNTSVSTSPNSDDDYTQTQKSVLYDLENENQSEFINEADFDSDISNHSDSDIKGSVSKDPSRRVPYMEVVGQVHGTYIIAQNENGMYMIDQHAAQERIKYEYFREKIGEVTNEIQNLLIPLTFHFSTDELMIINQQKRRVR